MDKSEAKRENEERKLMEENPKMLEIILSKERTIEAKLRTSISLIQTSIALFALGFAVLKVFEEIEFRIVAAGVLIIAIFTILIAMQKHMKYKKEEKKIENHRAHLYKVISCK
jgi:uncharacterized membrane protein YidH (DUF202 family)